MRFIHIADVHLGAKPDKGKTWSSGRGEEIEATFYRLLAEAGKKHVDLILIAGDVFHRPPLKRELKELNYRLEAIAPTKVVFMAGNHDFMGEHSHYHGFEWAKNVYFFDREELDYYYIEELNTWVYGLSYAHREISLPLYANAQPMDAPGYHILLAHGGDENIFQSNMESLPKRGLIMWHWGIFINRRFFLKIWRMLVHWNRLIVSILENMVIFMEKWMRRAFGFSFVPCLVVNIEI